MMSDKKFELFNGDNDGEESYYGITTGSLNVNSSRTMLIDHRIAWIRDKVRKFLGLNDNYKQIFDSILNDNNGYFYNKLMEFFNTDLYDVMDLERKLILFYKTYRNEVIQEEISVWEEKHIAESTMTATLSRKERSQRLTKSAPGKVEIDGEKIKKGKKSKKSKKSDKFELNNEMLSTLFTGVSSTQMFSISDDNGISDDDDNDENDEFSQADEGEDVVDILIDEKILYKPKLQTKSAESLRVISFVPPPGDEDKYILTKKVVDKVVEIPVVHMLFGEINSNNLEIPGINLFYFMRIKEEPIPNFVTWKMCYNEMTDFLIVGSLNGSYLATLNNILIYVLKPLVEEQYRGSRAAQKRIRDIHTNFKNDRLEKARMTLTNVLDTQTSAFITPSNFVELSMTIEQLEKIQISTDNQDIEIDNIHRKSTIESSKKELLEYLNNLTIIVQWTLEHSDADILLPVAELSDINGVNIMTILTYPLDKNTIKQLEKVVMNWRKHIEKVLETFVHKTPQSKGPMAEYKYWHERKTDLSMIVEQLNALQVRKILSVLNDVGSPIASAFHWYDIELWKHYTEARDNNKFLSTLFRYFKLITESDSFKAISEAIPTLIDGLRMIWILSKVYNTEEKMTSLFERISWQLCESVRTKFSIKLLFSTPLTNILEETMSAYKMMKSWKLSYLHTRQSIELSGKIARWEFDQSRLFKDTEYIAKVCNDFNKIANVLQDFYNIFGAELKSIINDPARIDAIKKKVDELMIPIQNADFNVFTEFNKENWDATMDWFYLEVTSLENDAKYFIDECFTVLISAEQALDMLLKFKNIKTREAIHKRLLMKFDIIMQQFSREINEIESIFNLGKRGPPLLRYHSLIAGGIYWERQLYYKLRSPVQRFQKVDELNDSYLKSLTYNQYINLVKNMKQFEMEKFNLWVDKAESTILNSMKGNLLKITPLTEDKFNMPKHLVAKINGNLSKISRSKDSRMQDSISADKSLYIEPSNSKIKSNEIKLRQLTNKIKYSTSSSMMMNDKIMIEHQLCFEINFDLQVFEIIQEAELLEQLGFELSISLRDLCIQKDRLKSDIKIIQAMIEQYNEIVYKLNIADIKLFKNIVQNIEKHIRSGVSRLNWYSLGITNYAVTCKKLLNDFGSIIIQANQMKRDIDLRIENDIGNYNLFTTTQDPISLNYELSACKTYFMDIERKRIELVDTMQKAYRSITPMLIKLENLVEGTSTGKSETMLHFYERYEYKIFTAFISCFLRNLRVLNDLLSGNKSIFQVDTILLASEVVLRPSPTEITAIVIHNVKNMLEQCKKFSRWMAGTCLECKPTKQRDSEDLTTLSFFEDIINIQIINNGIIAIQETTQKLALDCWRYLLRWKKYVTLWRLDKKIMCEKFALTNPTLQQYDEKFSFYDTIIEEIKEMVPYFDVLSIRINLIPLLKSIKDHAQEWKQILGDYLVIYAEKSMKNLKIKIEKYRTEVELVISGLDKFKIVMQAIANVKKMAIQVEVQYNEYQEIFRILKIHEIKYSLEDEEQSYKLEQDWKSLYLGALYRNTTLESTKERFCDMTKEQISDFLIECTKFMDYFNNNGPGNVNNNLDIGLERMEIFEKLIGALEKRRLDLVNAELLFDLPPTDYSIFTQVKSVFEGMKLIYSLYKTQKDARDVWSKTLWVDLNPQQLIDGMDQYIKKFRSFPYVVRQLDIGICLETMMINFKNSVPLFVELKNEAMRERHWQELMDKSGKHFDMSPDKCGNSFE